MRFALLRATFVAAFLTIGLLALPAQHARAFEDDSFTPPDPYEAVSHDLEPGGEVRSSSVQGVFGPDERVQVSQTTAAPYSMIAFILTEWSDGSVSSCTGFLVGARTVGTAGHCVFDRSERLGWAKRVLVSPGANGSQKPYGTFFATSVASVAGWTQASRTTQSVDFAAVTLATDVGATTGTFGLAPDTDAALQSGSFTVAGYPGDKSSATLWSAAGAIDRADSGLVYFRLVVTHGNSGGPIWKQTTTGPSIVGIVEGGSSSTNIGVRMSQPVIDRYRSWVGGANDTPSITPTIPSTIAPPQPRTLSASPSSLAAPTGHSAYSVLKLGAAEGAGDLVLRSSGGTLTLDSLLAPLSCAGGTKLCVGVTGSGTGSVTIPDSVNDLSSLVVTLAGTVVRDTTVTVTATQGTGSSPWQLAIPVQVKTDNTLGTNASSGQISSGTIPSSGGIGLIVFDGGTSEQLVTAAGCPSATAVFWVADGASFITYIPGASIASVNASWDAKFGSTGIPSGTAIIARCR